MNIYILLVLIAAIFGGLAVFCIMKIREFILKNSQQKEDLAKRLTDLEMQVKGEGKVPYMVRRWLEDKGALGNLQEGDLATMALYHEQMGNLLDGLIRSNEQNNELVRKIRTGQYDSDKPAMK